MIKDGQWRNSQAVSPKHLNCPLVAGSKIGHKLLPLYVMPSGHKSTWKTILMQRLCWRHLRNLTKNINIPISCFFLLMLVWCLIKKNSVRLPALQDWLGAPSSPTSPWYVFHPPPSQRVTHPSAHLTRMSALTWSTTCAPCTAALPCPWSQPPEDSALQTVSFSQLVVCFEKLKYTWLRIVFHKTPPNFFLWGGEISPNATWIWM